MEKPEVTLTTGLVAYYPFNGNANDESGNGNDGTVNGATLATDRNGGSGKAYSFDGEDDFVDLTTAKWGIEGNSARSIFAWVKTTHDQKFGMAIFSSGSTGNSQAFNIFGYGGILGIMGYDNDLYPNAGIKYNDGVDGLLEQKLDTKYLKECQMTLTPNGQHFSTKKQEIPL